MAIYMLDDNKMYETLPQPEEDKKAQTSPGQLRQLATTLSEHFGCFLLFGMSFKGEPKMLMCSSSGMENLSLRKFAEDIIMENQSLSFIPLDEPEE